MVLSNYGQPFNNFSCLQNPLNCYFKHWFLMPLSRLQPRPEASYFRLHLSPRHCPKPGNSGTPCSVSFQVLKKIDLDFIYISCLELSTQRSVCTCPTTVSLSKSNQCLVCIKRLNEMRLFQKQRERVQANFISVQESVTPTLKLCWFKQHHTRGSLWPRSYETMIIIYLSASGPEKTTVRLGSHQIWRCGGDAAFPIHFHWDVPLSSWQQQLLQTGSTFLVEWSCGCRSCLHTNVSTANWATQSQTMGPVMLITQPHLLSHNPVGFRCSVGVGVKKRLEHL